LDHTHRFTTLHGRCWVRYFFFQMVGYYFSFRYIYSYGRGIYWCKFLFSGLGGGGFGRRGGWVVNKKDRQKGN